MFFKHEIHLMSQCPVHSPFGFIQKLRHQMRFCNVCHYFLTNVRNLHFPCLSLLVMGDNSQHLVLLVMSILLCSLLFITDVFLLYHNCYKCTFTLFQSVDTPLNAPGIRYATLLHLDSARNTCLIKLVKSIGSSFDLVQLQHGHGVF